MACGGLDFYLYFKDCMIKKMFGFGIFLLMLFIVVSLMLFSKSLSGRIAWWGIDLDVSGLRLVSFSKDQTSFSEVEKLEAVSGTTKIFIDRTEIEDHKKYIEDKKFLLTSLFEPTTSPYPEVITNTIECASEFKPKARNVGNDIVFTLFAGERYNYGVCALDLVKYQSLYGIFDCKDKGIFEIRIFSTFREILKRIIGSFKC